MQRTLDLFSAVPEPISEKIGVLDQQTPPIITKPVTVALAVSILLLMLSTAINFQFPTLMHTAKVMTDFDAFFVSGKMYWEGTLNDAYHFQTLLEAQLRFTGTTSFMPWTYPPPFNLVTAALATLPIGLAYLVFIGPSLLAYTIVLRRIAGAHTATIILAIFPAIVLNVLCGWLPRCKRNLTIWRRSGAVFCPAC